MARPNNDTTNRSAIALALNPATLRATTEPRVVCCAWTARLSWEYAFKNLRGGDLAMTSIALGTATDTRRREAVVAGVIGNVLEWYDFAVFGYLVPVISQLFFPDANPYKSLLATLAVFGVGFVMRPVGSVVFGRFGDLYGRR